jgi:hypothetical protein
MSFKVRRIMLQSTPVGHVWYDRRWKWCRPGMGTRVFKSKTKVVDVMAYIANHYRCRVEDLVWYDTQGRA